MSERRQRQAAVRFRVTSGEQRLIEAAAKEAGQTVASFARTAALLAAGRAAKEDVHPTARVLRDVVGELQNLGQFARRRIVGTSEVERVEFELRRLQRLLFHFLRSPPPQ